MSHFKALHTDKMILVYVEHVTNLISPAIFRALFALRQEGVIDDIGDIALEALSVDVAEYCAENTAPIDTAGALCDHCDRAGRWIARMASTSRLPNYTAREWACLIDQTVKMYTAI